MLLLLGLFAIVHAGVYAQSSVDVNPLTGAANVAIPVYTIMRGQVTVPITLVYASSGVKPKDVEGTAGMGWQLLAGGSITRQVKGLPDDAYQDNAEEASAASWNSPNELKAQYRNASVLSNKRVVFNIHGNTTA